MRWSKSRFFVDLAFAAIVDPRLRRGLCGFPPVECGVASIETPAKESTMASDRRQFLTVAGAAAATTALPSKASLFSSASDPASLRSH